MNFGEPLVLAVLGVALVAAGWWLAVHFFSDEARWERRRRRSNSPIVNKSNRPSIKLSVRSRKRRK